MPYLFAKAADLKGKPVVGSGQCVALVQHFTGAPTTANWRLGDAVVGNQSLKAGTAIATFVDQRYPNHRHGNHAALFIKHAGDGIYIVDQWHARGGNGNLGAAHQIARSRQQGAIYSAQQQCRCLLRD